jgi:hypothetical protein
VLPKSTYVFREGKTVEVKKLFSAYAETFSAQDPLLEINKEQPIEI